MSLNVIWDSSTILHFILDAITAACSSRIGMIKTLEFYGANRDFPIMNEIFMSLPSMIRKYAHVPYANCYKSVRICNSTMSPLCSLKP